MPTEKKRRLYCVGDVNVPECDTADTLTGDVKSHTDHKMLSVVWEMASTSGRLFYRNESKIAPESFQAGSVAGSLAGLYALRHASIGRATEGMHSSIRHVASLDSAFSTPGVRIMKVATSGEGLSVVLLSTGILLTLSRDSKVHTMVISLPEEQPADGAKATDPAGVCRVLDIAAGNDHFICCDDQGRVYSWGGTNQYGQLGRGYVGARPTDIQPTRILSFGEDVIRPETKRQMELHGTLPYSVMAQRPAPSICAVACGRHHSVLLSATKSCVYTFGRGHRGQLGHGRTPNSLERTVELCCVPRSVGLVFGQEIQSIHAVPGSDHTSILLSTGTIFSFGDNTFGVCGTGSPKMLTTAAVATFQNPNTGEPEPTKTVNEDEEKRLKAVRAPYGSAESYKYARRVKSLSSRPAEDTPKVLALSTSPTHSVAVVRDAENELGVYSSGLRPIRVVQLDSHVDSYGALGRPISSKASSLCFGRMYFGDRVREAGRQPGVHVRAIAGNGFTAMIETGDCSSIYLHGSISVGGRALVGTGKKALDNSRRQLPGGSTAGSNSNSVARGKRSDSPVRKQGSSTVNGRSTTPTLHPEVSEDDGTSAFLLTLGPNHRAVDIFAVAGGLLILADDV